MSNTELQNGPSVDHLLSGVPALLDRVEHQIQVVIHSTKSSVYRDGKLDEQLFDQFQHRCYLIAVAKAELEAAKSLLRHAAAYPNAVLLKDCTIYFCSQSIKSILSCFTNEAIALGLDRKAVIALLGDEEMDNWLTLASSYGNLAEYCLNTGNSRLESGLSEEQELVRSTFQRFADDVVAPRAEEIHRQDKDIPEEIIGPAAELGCFGTCIPERFGGLQPDDKPDSLGMIIVTEELSRGSLGAAGSLITRPEIAARALLAGGTEAQQQKWLPQLATGEKLCAISITEPNTGSDVAAVALRASPCEGGWRLNGSKTWCTFAGRSELVVVLARTNSDTELGHKGLSLFVVEKPVFSGHEFEHKQKDGGSFSGKAISTLGYRGMHSYQLFFDDYFVANDCLIGEKEGEGKGFYYTMSGFAGGRLQTAARATGVMQAAFEAALSYASDRKIFEKALAEFQLTQTKLTRMLATVTASRQFSYAVARLMDDGGGQMEASLVKLFSCRAAEWIAREAMQIHGGMGYAEESAVSRYFVDARVLSIFEGAEEVLAIRVIARGLMEQHDSENFAAEHQQR